MTFPEPPAVKTLLWKPIFNIIQGKTGHIKIWKNHPKPKQLKTEDIVLEVPTPISPLPLTRSGTPNLDITDNPPRKCSSTSTICQDEILMYSQINEQLIYVSSIYGIF